ncbi:hypothetical protein K2Z83_13570 [Oscillochloris sp. ZM17-4]|uniref:hypothetical protein n=1 Tax=Oscillochloris sp. ZM17-4 TaxID=2866714 RepID=UPI001C73A6CA|nr:hypothetical protein [Oscillochloris sp. ZM17-4]MBX0328706.1 hypothetical protein [Oscillochloris sp. ZM17-4]
MLARAYVRRKRFEARLIAEEVAALFRERQPDAANPSRPSPTTPRPSEAPVPPSALLRTMGITF